MRVLSHFLLICSRYAINKTARPQWIYDSSLEQSTTFCPWLLSAQGLLSANIRRIVEVQVKGAELKAPHRQSFSDGKLALLKLVEGRNRQAYFLRYTYAILKLLKHNADNFTLSG